MTFQPVTACKAVSNQNVMINIKVSIINYYKLVLVNNNVDIMKCDSSCLIQLQVSFHVVRYIYIFYLLWVLYSRYAIFDTPGQIEVFTWSASGAIITEALASSFATIVVYIIDTARSTSPVTFMSNMLYACSILYKTKLPFIVVLNKVSIIIFSLNSATQ